ncbi:MAG TPA: gliding motility-associated C-terminal domain-containing protein, partial [Cytophagaceae bacterium]
SLFSYDIQSVGNITDFIWTRQAVAGISNPATQGQGNRIDEVLNNTMDHPVNVTYVVSPLNPLNCPVVDGNLVVTVNPRPEIINNPQDDGACPGGTASFSVIANAATIGYQWQVRNAAGQFENIDVNDPVYSGVNTGTLTLTGVTEVMDQKEYRCVVTSICGASVVDVSSVARLTVHQLPLPVLPPQFVDVCPGTPIILTPGVFSNSSYIWEKNGEVLPFETNDTLLVNATEDATYTVTVAHNICGNVAPVSTEIKVIKFVSLGVRTSDSCADYTSTLTPVVLQGDQPVEVFVWTIGSSAYYTSSNVPDLTHMFTSMGIHPVRIEAYYNSCQIGDTVVNIVMNDCSIKLTNTFTPNGDGVNDTWHIPNMHNYPNAKVQIFNRWGEYVYESTNGYVEEWDGTVNGKQCEEGVYYYVIILNKDSESGGNTGVYKGSLTLIR